MAERRAARISEPVDKLRYLRRAVGRCDKVGVRAGWFTRRRVLLAALLLAPVPTTSDVPWPVSVEDPMPLPPPASTESPGRVWLVDHNRNFELYSNGLRVETSFAVEPGTRWYTVYDRVTLQPVGRRTQPAGIVYHTTESHLAPFEPGQTERLLRVSEWLLDFVRRNRSYHFVIDRFGRVHRVVPEEGPANHAGYSVWADRRFAYVNLNASFLGIAFETRGGAKPETISPAQVHAAKVLTEALRNRYAIPRENCVTHAQVSVLPAAALLGNHTDWAANFPYAELGLSDNYTIPSPALAVFGFRYRPELVQAAGEPFWRGVVLGEVEFRQRAAAKRLAEGQYRAARRARYRQILKESEEAQAQQENSLR